MNAKIKTEGSAITTQEFDVAWAPSGLLWNRMGRLWQRLRKVSQRPPKRLRLAESLSLGERRFVAVVEYGTSRFLLGGTSSSLVLLADLHGSSTDSRDPETNQRTAGSGSEDMARENKR